MIEEAKTKQCKYSESPKEGSFFYQEKGLLIAPIVHKVRTTADFGSLSVSEKQIFDDCIAFMMQKFLLKDKELYNWFLGRGLESEREDCIYGAWLRLKYQIEGKKFKEEENNPDSQGECEKSPDDEDEEEEEFDEEEEEEGKKPGDRKKPGKRYNKLFEKYPDEKSLELDYELNQYIYKVLKDKAKAEAKKLLAQTAFIPEFKQQGKKQTDTDNKKQNLQTVEVAADEQTSETVSADDDNGKIEKNEKKYATIDSIEDENKLGEGQWDGDETHCHESEEERFLYEELKSVMDSVIKETINKIEEQDSTAKVFRQFYKNDERYRQYKLSGKSSEWVTETLNNRRIPEEGGHAVVFVLFFPWNGWKMVSGDNYGYESAAAYINCKTEGVEFDPENSNGKSTVENRYKRIAGFMREIFMEKKYIGAKDTDKLAILLDLLEDMFEERKPGIILFKKKTGKNEAE